MMKEDRGGQGLGGAGGDAQRPDEEAQRRQPQDRAEQEQEVDGAPQARPQAVVQPDHQDDDRRGAGRQDQGGGQDGRGEQPARQRHDGVAAVHAVAAQLGEVDRQAHEQEVGHHGEDKSGEHGVDEVHSGADLGGAVGDADEDVHDHRERQGEEHRDGLAQEQDELLTRPHGQDPPPGRGAGAIGYRRPRPLVPVHGAAHRAALPSALVAAAPAVPTALAAPTVTA